MVAVKIVGGVPSPECTWWKEGTDSFKVSFDLHMYAGMCTYKHIHKINVRTKIKIPWKLTVC